jgi:hypothetical protein
VTPSVVTGRRIGNWLALAFVAGAVLIAGAAVSVAAKRAASQAAAPPAAPGPDGGAPAEPSNKVRILIQTVPPEKATVFWGKKPIGVINPQNKGGKGKNKALIIERPRDSGPMDVVVRAKDFVPVHTRAYTFTDSQLFVKLTPVEEKKTLFGYREALPDAGAPEAGAAAAPPGMMAASPDAGPPR